MVKTNVLKWLSFKHRNYKLAYLSLAAISIFSHENIKASENSLSEEYKIKRNFINAENCDQLYKEAEKMVEKYYTQENVKNHIAYLADIRGAIDIGEGRKAYAFVVHHSSGTSEKDLPGLSFNDLPSNIQKISQQMEATLGIEKGRYLINFQMYHRNSEYLPLHFDGELYKFNKHSDGNVTITEAIIPDKTSVLTLINFAKGGGTKIATKDKASSIVAECKVGDLLIFNNANVLHGADSFKVEVGFKERYVRFTMGWRSLEYNCNYLNDTHVRKISYDEAVKMNKYFMKERWPTEFIERTKAAY